MEKGIAFLTAMVILLGLLSACGGDNSTEIQTATETQTATDPGMESSAPQRESEVQDSNTEFGGALEDLPELYSEEQAMIDGCLVSRDGVATHNKERFREFVVRCNSREAGFFRIVNWYYGEDSGFTVHDLNFDGSTYTLSWLEDGQTHSKEYRHLMHYSGETEPGDDAAYDAFEYYVLTNDNTALWGGMPNSQSADTEDDYTVFADYIYYPKKMDIPDNLAQAVLEFQNQPLVTVTDQEQLMKLRSLFDSAELLGYEPKTHSVGLDLNLILTTQSGETMTIELDPDNDICRIQGAFIFYGAYDEPCYILKLWEYLGISQWPDPVYELCQSAFRPEFS